MLFISLAKFCWPTCRLERDAALQPALASGPLSLSAHNEINTLQDRALNLACITKISLDYAAGPLLARFSPAGHLIQQELWQGHEGE